MCVCVCECDERMKNDRGGKRRKREQKEREGWRGKEERRERNETGGTQTKNMKKKKKDWVDKWAGWTGSLCDRFVIPSCDVIESSRALSLSTTFFSGDDSPIVGWGEWATQELACALINFIRACGKIATTIIRLSGIVQSYMQSIDPILVGSCILKEKRKRQRCSSIFRSLPWTISLLSCPCSFSRSLSSPFRDRKKKGGVGWQQILFDSTKMLALLVVHRCTSRVGYGWYVGVCECVHTTFF